MSTIDGYWLSFGASKAARGRSGVLRTVTVARGRSCALRAQPEVVQAHGLRNCLVITNTILLALSALGAGRSRVHCRGQMPFDGVRTSQMAY